MITIYKYPLKVERYQEIRTYSLYEVLTIQLQDNFPVMWVRVDTDSPIKTTIQVHMIPTGEDISHIDFSSGIKYIATTQIGGYVAHYFIRKLYDSI